MKTYIGWLMLGFCLLAGGYVFKAEALMETGQTVVYKVTHHTSAGELESFVAYSLAGQTADGYWMQRTTHMQNPESQPLSITQNLLDAATHQPLRYLKYRPANMGRPAVAVDLPLDEMGADEMFPLPLNDMFAEAGSLEVPDGVWTVWVIDIEKFTIWVNPDVPVLGIVKAEAPDWTMELFRIDPQATDLLPNKPPKGGRAFVEEE